MANRFSTVESDAVEESTSKITAKIISWYPGHIAKAERELSEYLKKVDVVIEVRDARIPLATTHPSVPKWVGSKPLIIAIARLDQITNKALAEWKEYYARNPAYPERPDARVFFIDGKTGGGVIGVKKQALKASEKLNAKRASRGILPRAVRAAIIGFPNVGKSTLINRLLGKKLAVARNMPGVTRQLQWVRLGGLQGASQEHNIELLDSPGIIPARQFDQEVAVKLAICNDIGEASYDRVVVAAALVDLLNQMQRKAPAYTDSKKLSARYQMPLHEMSGDTAVQRIADKFYRGNDISAADRLLSDFRKGLLGGGSLECVQDAPVYEGFRRADGEDDEGDKNSSGRPLTGFVKPKTETKKKTEKGPVKAPAGETIKYEGGIEAVEEIDPEVLKRLQDQLAKEEAKLERQEARKQKMMNGAAAATNKDDDDENLLGETYEVDDDGNVIDGVKKNKGMNAKDIGKGGHEGW